MFNVYSKSTVPKYHYSLRAIRCSVGRHVNRTNTAGGKFAKLSGKDP